MEYYIPNKVMEPTWNLQSPARARRQFPKPFGNISISSRVIGSSSSCIPTAPSSYCPRSRFGPCAAWLRARGVQLLRKWTRRSQPGLRKGIEPPHENDWSRYKHFGSVLCAGRPSAVAQSHCGYGTASDGTKPWVREYCCARGDGVGTGTLLPPQKARNCHCYRADTWGRRAVGGTRSRGCHRFDRAMGRTGLICRCSRRRDQRAGWLFANAHLRPQSAAASRVRASVKPPLMREPHGDLLSRRQTAAWRGPLLARDPAPDRVNLQSGLLGAFHCQPQRLAQERRHDHSAVHVENHGPLRGRLLGPARRLRRRRSLRYLRPRRALALLHWRTGS